MSWGPSYGGDGFMEEHIYGRKYGGGSMECQDQSKEAKSLGKHQGFGHMEFSIIK